MRPQYPTPLLLLLAGAAIFLVASGIVVVYRLRTGPRLSRVAVALAAAPRVVIVALFYSLAIHLRWSLGKWPATIGDEGFPLALKNHATLAINYYLVLWGVSLIRWSAAFVVSLLNAPWRRFTAGVG